jgi:iron complex outermembrane receptor protein
MKTFYSIVFLFLCLWLLYPEDIYAQEDTSGYETEEIIVTGTRVEQKLIDIPFSVERIDQNVWKSSRKMSLLDVLPTVPGLFLQPRYGNHDVRVTIRGFGSRSNSGIRGVRILLDGIPESEPDGQTRIEWVDFAALGRIEIVKGNSSSLYTNAPGGVINFMSDKYFNNSFVSTINEFGSYEMRKNGLKFGIKTGNAVFMTNYSYENYKGYRTHSSEYQHRLNMFFETNFTEKSKISIYGYYVNGLIQLPGSLKLADYNKNDTAANSRDFGRNARRETKKGRIGVTFNTEFGDKKMSHLIEVTGYGTIKYFNRVAATFRIFDRSGIGSSFRYINRTKFFFFDADRINEFSVGGDLFFQTGPIQEFNRVGWGEKGDELQTLTDETISNAGFYFLERFPIINKRLDLLITGRFDRVYFEANNNLQNELDTERVFQKFTPKAALNFKITPKIAIYTSIGKSFDSPAFNEMDNYIYTSNPDVTINPDLRAQQSLNFEAGIKGNLPALNRKFFQNTFFELTYFRSVISDEIVPFVIESNVYYRNAAKSVRNGIEFGLNTYPIDKLNFKTAYTFSDFKYKEYKAGTIDANGILTEKDFSGKYMASIPKHLLSTEISYTYPFAKYFSAFVKLNHQYVGEMFVDDANTDSLKTEAYNLFNAQVGFNVYYKSLQILAYGGVNNIADKKYVAFINANSDRGEFYESGPRRNFFCGMTVGWLFNR